MKRASFEHNVELEQRIDPQVLLRRAIMIIRARRKRIELFGASMFREPAWDMLLALFVASEGRRLTIGRLTAVVGAPMTTALRWIQYLIDQGLVIRELHPTDARAVFVELSESGKSLIELYLYETLMIAP